MSDAEVSIAVHAERVGFIGVASDDTNMDTKADLPTNDSENNWPCCDRISHEWNHFTHGKRFQRFERIMLAILSTADHWSDIVLVFIWFTEDIPTIVPLQGLIFWSLTSIFPIFAYPEWYVKLAMPFGIGTFPFFTVGVF